MSRPARFGYQADVARLHWLLCHVPPEHHLELFDLFPETRMIWQAMNARPNGFTHEVVQRLMECSEATAYRWLAALREAGCIGAGLAADAGRAA